MCASRRRTQSRGCMICRVPRRAEIAAAGGEAMRTLRVPFAVGLLVALASVGWVWAQGRNSSGALTGQDCAEIHQLYARYAQGTDLHNAEMWLDVFTKDAIFRPTFNQDRRRGEKGAGFKGRAEMAKWRRHKFPHRPPNHT